MKISGFTFVRNAIKFDYPIVEAITSILPICDEVVVAVGNSEDATLALIQSIDSPKIKIIETVWDDSLRKGGQVLAVETDKALAAVSPDADWCFYIQGDEVVHEKYLPVIKKAMQDNLHKTEVEGLLFNYTHFYGSYRYVGNAHRWYRREIRVIRNTGKVHSYKDAQGFRTVDNQKLKVKLIDAYIYHYGWVKPPEIQREKMKSSINFWGEGHDVDKIKEVLEAFDYSEIDSLTLFDGTHPAVMQARIDSVNWMFDYDIHEKKLSLKNQLKMTIEKLTGYRIGEYRNYKMV
ncbi:glycosyltransferase family 2 protein [Arcicella aquatica]|uniref:Glycosyltransferase family 2 protein n=1 Tax=Arcicella aquatica TaxID=217141 RepID=A0ABU5QN15_9BACT|nr:glycosyltransferase family 2 protein [Arcicella aquatica]MEA5258458.1 glycosyltransferase family 2 protein [Arcicella aquatica]